MCTYNGARWLGEQLASLAAQMRPPDELVICDDRSGDSTVEIIRSFASSAAFPVRLHVNETNLGPAANFGKAMSFCGGDVIFFCDQDDVWLPDKIARMTGVLENAPAVGAVLGNAELVDEALRPLPGSLWDAIPFTPAEQAAVRSGRAAQVLARKNVATGATMAFRSEFRKLALPVPDIERCMHDAWVALLISAVAEIALLPEPVIRQRLHAGNRIGTRRRSLREQIAMGREHIRSQAFLHDAQVFAAARDRLAATHARPTPDFERMVAGKISHMMNRHQMPRGFLRRLPAICREVRTGGYSKYSLGWRSLAQDLFLR
jgi:glycosyltransferase involved in cell wall biosynthesis